MRPRARRLYAPSRVRVEAEPGSAPRAVAGVAVEAMREEWLVEDRWWMPPRLRRHYYELVLADGSDVVVFRSGKEGPWYRQRA